MLHLYISLTIFAAVTNLTVDNCITDVERVNFSECIFNLREDIYAPEKLTMQLYQNQGCSRLRTNQK